LFAVDYVDKRKPDAHQPMRKDARLDAFTCVAWNVIHRLYLLGEAPLCTIDIVVMILLNFCDISCDMLMGYRLADEPAVSVFRVGSLGRKRSVHTCGLKLLLEQKNGDKGNKREIVNVNTLIRSGRKCYLKIKNELECIGCVKTICYYKS
jgi:hypothetical protein